MIVSLALAQAEQEELAADAADMTWLLIALVVGALVFLMVTVPSLMKHRGRAPEIARHAKTAGMRFQEQDGPGLGRTRFQLLVPTNGLNWNAFNVITSERNRAQAHGFDIRVWTEVEVTEDRERRGPFDPEPTRKKVVRQTRGATMSGCIVTLPINAPRVLIVRENLATKFLASVSRIDLDLESDLFNRSYHVLTSDPEFARAVLDARVLDLIVQSEGRMEFEFFGTKLLIRAPMLEPELLPGLITYGERFPNVISDLVRDRYRNATALDG